MLQSSGLGKLLKPKLLQKNYWDKPIELKRRRTTNEVSLSSQTKKKPSFE